MSFATIPNTFAGVFLPETSDAGFVSGVGAPPTAAWTVLAPNAVLTVTNPGAVAADVTVYVDIYTWGST
jgi:hypothetical protein